MLIKKEEEKKSCFIFNHYYYSSMSHIVFSHYVTFFLFNSLAYYWVLKHKLIIIDLSLSLLNNNKLVQVVDYTREEKRNFIESILKGLLKTAWTNDSRAFNLHLTIIAHGGGFYYKNRETK
jgi:hypothetical protein